MQGGRRSTARAVQAALAQLGLGPAARPEELTPPQWVRFAQLLLDGRARGVRRHERHAQRLACASPTWPRRPSSTWRCSSGPVRPDGFHEIASLMVPVTLADLVRVERTPGAGLHVVCDVAPGEQNLAARMVRELEQRLGRSLEVRVTITKTHPAWRRAWAAAAPTPPPRSRLWSASSTWTSRCVCATRSPRP